MRYLIANWKMNMNLKEVSDWLSGYLNEYHDRSDKCEVVIAASGPYIALVGAEASKAHISVAGQDVSVFTKGAHTGEIGAFQLVDFCKYCIVGHSERNETNDVVTEKASRCIELGIKPIICFVTPEQLQKYKSFEMNNVIYAWEDPNNISKDGIYKPKNPVEISSGAVLIRQLIRKETTLIYGGSVNIQNIKDIAGIKDLDGVLVGNASTDPKHFSDIISEYNKNQ